MRREAFRFVAGALCGCAQVAFAPAALAGPHDALIARHAAANGVPEQLVRRVIRIESRGNAAAANAGNYGLMQIRLGTARGVGYVGEAEGLLDPDINLTYAVKYLAGAYRAAGCDSDRAVSYYQRGYYGAPQFECGSAPAALLQTVQAEIPKPDPKAARKRDAAKRKPDADPSPADVIKPKVVRTETIAPSNTGPAPARPVGRFEPVRAATLPAQPVAPQPAAKFGLASVPLPPVRPEFDPAPKPDAKAVRRLEHLQTGAGKKAKADDGSPAVLTFLKKLVTPDKTPRKRSLEADAAPLAQAQPPQ